MTVSFKASDLNPWIEQIASLVNLISVAGDTATLNEAWFKNPWGNAETRNINGIAYRPGPLLTLLADILGPADALPVSVVATSPAGTPLLWYPVRVSGRGTGVSVVLSDPAADYAACPGYVGAGLRADVALAAGYSVSFALYLPLYALDPSTGGTPVFCGPDTPAQVILSVSSASGLMDGTTPFETVQIIGDLALGQGTSPTLSAAFIDAAGAVVERFTTLSAFFDSAAPTIVNQVLAAASVNDWLHAAITAQTPVTPGQVLQATGLLTEQAGAYAVSDLPATFGGKSALSIAEMMVFNALDLLAANDKPIVPISSGGIYVLSVDLPNGSTDYGLRLALPDIELGSVPDDAGTAQPATGANAAKPQLAVQIGKWLTGETGYDDSWMARSRSDGAAAPDPAPVPGLSLLVVRHMPSGETDFHLSVAAVSVGIDYIGSVANPLVNVKGFVLGGVELRGEASVTLGAGSAAEWGLGGAMRADHMGIPLGTSFNAATTQGNNPVAATSVASGTGTGGNAATGKTDAVNPTFSASASYILGGQLGVQLYDANDAPTDVVWFPVQASFGPLFCKTLGVGWQQSTDLLSLIVDGGVSALGLSVELLDLSVGIPVTAPTDLSAYQLGLAGLNVAFKEGPIEVSAGLVQNNAYTPPDYEGDALLRLWRFNISAMGAYSTTDGAPSLFIFAMMDFPIFGIPAFFVNGLSAGFGYNRSLTLPNVSEVSKFPLVAGLDNPALLGTSPGSALKALGDWVQPSRGDYWLAAGMKWTTYDIVNTSALLSVAFGNSLELGITGLSLVSLPQGTDRKFAYAELGLELVLDIGGDEFIAAAALGPKSFIIDKNFKLSGGFALDAWWGDSAQSGDFVMTLGGYSAAYKPPAHYPSVDRLGFSFAFSSALTMGGELYFALTTSNVMAGGSIDVSASALGCKLWFTGEADLILFWQPFYFDAHMAASAGASYTLSLLGASVSMKIEASGSFNLWSPETGGTIELDFWFLKVPISFGAKQAADATLPVDWDTFATLLPPAAGSLAPDAPTKTPPAATPSAATPSSKRTRASASLAATMPEDTAPPPDPAAGLSLVQINPATGFVAYVDSLDGPGAPQAWLVRPALFGFSTSTVIPSATLSAMTPSGAPEVLATSDAATGILPMAATITVADHLVTLTNLDTAQVLDPADWRVSPSTIAMPEALWSIGGGTPPAEPGLIPDCLNGIKDMRHAPPAALTGPPAFDIVKAFAYHIVADSDQSAYLPLSASARPATTGAPAISDSSILDVARINDAPQVAARSALFAVLAEMGVDAGTDGSLAAMAAQPSGALRASPLLGSVAAAA